MDRREGQKRRQRRARQERPEGQAEEKQQPKSVQSMEKEAVLDLDIPEDPKMYVEPYTGQSVNLIAHPVICKKDRHIYSKEFIELEFKKKGEKTTSPLEQGTEITPDDLFESPDLTNILEAYNRLAIENAALKKEQAESAKWKKSHATALEKNERAVVRILQLEKSLVQARKQLDKTAQQEQRGAAKMQAQQQLFDKAHATTRVKLTKAEIEILELREQLHATQRALEREMTRIPDPYPRLLPRLSTGGFFGGGDLSPEIKSDAQPSHSNESRAFSLPRLSVGKAGNNQ